MGRWSCAERHRAALALTLSALVGCAGAAPAGGAATDPSSAPTPSAVERSPRDECLADLDASLALSESDPILAADAWARCAAVIEAEACRDAIGTWRSAPDGQRAARIVAACAPAYCPRLEPAPAVCTTGDPGDWPELGARLLALELGLSDAAARAEPLAAQLEPPQMDGLEHADAPEPSTVVHLSLVGDRVEARVGEGGSPRALGQTPSEAELAAMAAAARESAGDGEAVLLLITPGLPYPVFRAAAEALAAAGFEFLTVRVDRSDQFSPK